jgi:hypothetical protein
MVVEDLALVSTGGSSRTRRSGKWKVGVMLVYFRQHGARRQRCYGRNRTDDVEETAAAYLSWSRIGRIVIHPLFFF